jgi:hypothetical protein
MPGDVTTEVLAHHRRGRRPVPQSVARRLDRGGAETSSTHHSGAEPAHQPLFRDHQGSGTSYAFANTFPAVFNPVGLARRRPRGSAPRLLRDYHPAVQTLSVSSPVPLDAWREVVAADPGSMINQTPQWAAAVRSVRPDLADASRLYVLPDGRQLLLPLMRRSPMPGLVLESSGDLLATGGVRSGDVTVVLEDLIQRRRVSRIIVSGNYRNADAWKRGCPGSVASRPRRIHVLDLDGGFDRVWSERFQPAMRRAVRKAERSGLTVERDTAGNLTSTFYEVSRLWMDDKSRETRLPPWLLARTVAGRAEPVELFRAVALELGDACRQWVAWHSGVPVAAMITLVHGEHALFWRGYSVKSVAGPLRANNLLQKMAIEDACDSGCRYYAMGESGGVESLERYKESFGAVPCSVPEIRLEGPAVATLVALKRRAEAGAGFLTAAGRRAHRRLSHNE